MKTDKDILTVKMFKLGEPSSAGIIWTKEAAEQMITKFNESRLSGESYDIMVDSAEDQIVNDLSNVSHSTEAITLHEDSVFATIRLLDTPRGTEVKNLMEHLALQVQSRAFGTVTFDDNGNKVVEELSSICSFNIVSSPVLDRNKLLTTF